MPTHGWGAWSIEVGWTQAWIPTVLALRELETSLWEMTKDSKIAKHWEKTKAMMLPEDEINPPGPGKKVKLAQPPDARYSDGGAD